MSSLDNKRGVLLKATLNNKVMFADYFPHLPMGDRCVDQFLSEFKFQDHDYDKKVFDLLLGDNGFQKLVPKKFFNHQLWSVREEIKSPVIKYKLLHKEDYEFLPALKKGTKVRLDANGMFSGDDFKKYLKEISPDLLKHIEYIEDPLAEKNWKDLAIPAASDFIEGSPFEFYIYKPNCEKKPECKEKIIFSSYLGGNLGRWHSYCELVLHGDLSLVHGIRTEGFYNEEILFTEGSYQDGFIADMNIVKKIYQKASNLNWKELCSM